MQFKEWILTKQTLQDYTILIAINFIFKELVQVKVAIEQWSLFLGFFGHIQMRNYNENLWGIKSNDTNTIHY